MTEIDNEQFMRALTKMQADGKIHIIGETIIQTDAPEGTAERAFERMSMVFAFTDQSQSYTAGFEAGMIWQRIQSGESTIDCGFQEGFPVREENLETLNRMATAAGLAIETEPTPYEGWHSLRMSPSPKARLKLVEE